MSEMLQPDGGRAASADLSALIGAAAEPLPEIDDAAFGRMFDRFADARVVLLGEASHGTSEFYRARAAITRRLIEQHGFSVVALEADWPDARVFDAHVRRRPSPVGADEAFTRFPTWMWRNEEFDAFLSWLREHNRDLEDSEQAGVYGLDLYNLAASMRTVIRYLEQEDPEAAQVARERYGCLEPWAENPARYGRRALSGGYSRCERAVNAMLREMLEKQMSGRDGEALLDAAQSARLVRDAEAYYRAMYLGGAESWNLRDRHMFETLESLLETKGPKARAVVWAHNSHIGDARATEMGTVREELNIGQLCREKWGEQARLIGFGTHTGTVACADDWDEPTQIKKVRPSMAGSFERLSHDSGAERFLLDLRPGVHEAARQALVEPQLERMIGVIYRPETERWSHYVECRLSEQFDAWVWFDETRAVTPLATRSEEHDASADETWPSGL
ncbi:erythromycin esterase family protein [Phenylobacterium deserti]|nr:erythromycin esterase family protein [Phenylobacterium deserti]